MREAGVVVGRGGRAVAVGASVREAPVRLAVALTLVVTLYNNLAVLLPDAVRLPGYVPMNLVAGALLGVLAFRLFGLTLADVGLAWRSLLPASRWGGATGLAITAPVFAALLFPETAGFVSDARASDLTGASFLYSAVVRIPIGTALFEEWVFRGVLFGVWWRLVGPRAALLVPSVAFGLWHIGPSLDAMLINQPDAGALLLAGFVTLSVAATFVGGLLFTLLRVRAGGLAASVIAHALINALSLTAVFVA